MTRDEILLYLFIVLIIVWGIYLYINEQKAEKLQDEKEADWLINAIEKAQMKQRIDELDEILFLVSDTLHEEFIRDNFNQKDISELLTKARLFTSYQQDKLYTINEKLVIEKEKIKKIVKKMKDEIN
jgi:hypothetical protein